MSDKKTKILHVSFDLEVPADMDPAEYSDAAYFHLGEPPPEGRLRGNGDDGEIVSWDFTCEDG
jgi:hypothetical protein